MIDAREDVSASASQPVRRGPKISASRKSKTGKVAGNRNLNIERVFSDAKINPFEQVEWDQRTAEITDDAGKVIFKQENVDVP